MKLNIWNAVFLLFQVCTNIIEKNANPEWNQLINLQIKVCMCGDILPNY